MIAVQLDFFRTEQECEIDALRREMIALRTSTDKVRKGLFARNGELVKRMLELEDRLAVIERGICHGDLSL